MYFSQEQDLPEEKLSDLSDGEKQWHALTQAYQKLWDPVSAAKAKLDANLLEAEAVWGCEITVKITPLNRTISELFWSIKDHLEAQNPSCHHENPVPEDMKKLPKIIYSRGNIEKDEYLKELMSIIADIEAELRPHIIQYHR